MRSSSLGLALSNVRPHIRPPTLPEVDSSLIIAYEDTRAEPVPSHLILYGSIVLTGAIVVFNIFYLIAY